MQQCVGIVQLVALAYLSIDRALELQSCTNTWLCRTLLSHLTVIIVHTTRTSDVAFSPG